jgi:GNAT superfamily N-acetyltransferase
MNYEIQPATEEDKESLAELRISAMKESLEYVGRFDPIRARNRFLETFCCADTKKISISGEIVGFYVVKNNEDHVYLDHLYFYPKYQNLGLGGSVLATIKNYAQLKNKPIRLGALRKSRSNDFYKKHGFSFTHEEEWDIYYEFTHG